MANESLISFALGKFSSTFFYGLIARNLVSGAMRMYVSGHGVNRVALLLRPGWDRELANGHRRKRNSNLSDDAKRKEAIWVNLCIEYVNGGIHMRGDWTFPLIIDYRRICINFEFRHCHFSRRCRMQNFNAVLHKTRNSIWVSAGIFLASIRSTEHVRF